MAEEMQKVEAMPGYAVCCSDCNIVLGVAKHPAFGPAIIRCWDCYKRGLH